MYSNYSSPILSVIFYDVTLLRYVSPKTHCWRRTSWPASCNVENLSSVFLI